MMLFCALWLLCVAPATAESPRLIAVPEDYVTIAEAIAAAPDGAHILVAPGEYAENLVITRPLSVSGLDRDSVILRGTDDTPVITITDTQNITLRGLTIQGGEYGVFVLRSQYVTIAGNHIREAKLAGIKVRMGQANISQNIIADTQPPYGKGIHITNTTAWPDTVIQDNLIYGHALAGITTNMAGVHILNNAVRDNGQRGIAVTEMTRAIVSRNGVWDNAENGIYISDQSEVVVCNNIVTASSLPAISDSARYGNGITIDFGSTVVLYGNTVEDNAHYGVVALESSRLTMSENTVNGNGAEALWLDTTSRTQPTLTLPEECR